MGYVLAVGQTKKGNTGEERAIVTLLFGENRCGRNGRELPLPFGGVGGWAPSENPAASRTEREGRRKLLPDLLRRGKSGDADNYIGKILPRPHIVEGGVKNSIPLQLSKAEEVFLARRRQVERRGGQNGVCVLLGEGRHLGYRRPGGATSPIPGPGGKSERKERGKGLPDCLDGGRTRASW